MPIDPMLPLHNVVPSWTLPDQSGQPWSLFKPRGRAHTLLLVASDGRELPPYLEEAAAMLAELADLPARGVAVLPRTTLSQQFPPWIVVDDAQGTVRQKYLPRTASIGLFVLDRYNDLYYQWLASGLSELPSLGNVAEWMEAIGRQCGI